MKDEQKEAAGEAERRLKETLGDWDGNPHRTPLGHWMVNLPAPVKE
jgi:hypothetical protein